MNCSINGNRRAGAKVEIETCSDKHRHLASIRGFRLIPIKKCFFQNTKTRFSLKFCCLHQFGAVKNKKDLRSALRLTAAGSNTTFARLTKVRELLNFLMIQTNIRLVSSKRVDSMVQCPGPFKYATAEMFL